MKIVVLSDLHYNSAATADSPHPLGRFSDIFLLRAVHRINRWIKPDLVILCGDLTNRGAGADDLRTLKQYIDMIEAETIILRGNHDLPAEEFYSILPEPPEVLDIGGFRFVSFNDKEFEIWSAERSAEDIARGRRLAEEFGGRTVFVQHVPLFRPGTIDSHCRVRNAEEALDANVFLTISGHLHAFRQYDGACGCVVAPALSDETMPYLVVTIEDNGKVRAETETLAIPDGFFDSHIHTKFAYCQENMDPDRVLELVRIFNLSRFALTEHSGQLYCSAPDYWGGNLQRQGLNNTERQYRIPDYLALLDELGKRADFLRGFEVDVAQDGSLLVLPEDLAKVSLRVGAVHWLSATDRAEQEKEFLFRTEALLRQGCQILAHPFRVFS